MARHKKRLLFVDGYNILYAWPDLVSVMSDSLETARYALLDILSEQQAMSDEDITVVFDAHDVKGAVGAIEDYKGLKVVFTRQYETADAYIERQLDRQGKLDHIRVATSDGALQRLILGRGGTRLSASELRLECDQRKEKNLGHHVKTRIGQNDHLVSIDPETLKKLEDLRSKL